MVNSKASLGAARALAICIDSMSLDYVRPHLDRLPVLRSLLERGRVQMLSSPANRLTASIWATFATGEAPGAHGHYYPFQWDREAMKFERTSSARWRKRLAITPFWHDLARRGVPTIAFDAGTAYDARLSPHTEIINWCYQSSSAASATTPALLAELRRRFGYRPIGKEVPVPKTLAHSRRLRDDLIASINAKTEATLWLMDREDWRFFLLGFYEIHRAGHNLMVVDGDFGSPADPDALLSVYEAQDRALGRILDKAHDNRTTTVLFSLHSTEPNRAQDHFLDPILSHLADAWARHNGAAPQPTHKPNAMARLRAAIPARVQYSLAYMLGEHIQDWVVNRGMTGGRNWRRTPAFRYASGGEAYIRLNIKGRERDGCLEKGDVAKYVTWLTERLGEIKVTGTDLPLFRDVIDARVHFPGARSDYLPDLILGYAPDEPVREISSPAIGRISAHLDTGRGGNHSGEAFMIVAGPGQSATALSEVRDIGDIGAFIEALLLTPDAVTSGPTVAPAFLNA